MRARPSTPSSVRPQARGSQPAIRLRPSQSQPREPQAATGCANGRDRPPPRSAHTRKPRTQPTGTLREGRWMSPAQTTAPPCTNTPRVPRAACAPPCRRRSAQAAPRPRKRAIARTSGNPLGESPHHGRPYRSSLIDARKATYALKHTEPDIPPSPPPCSTPAFKPLHQAS